MESIVGVICEGHADRAVIINILKGVLGIDESNIRALLPINKTDETDRSRIASVEEFGGWTSVKNECIEKKIISQFLSLEGQDFIVVHLDTAEASEYGISSIPEKNDNYADNLRALLVELVDGWLEEEDIIKCTIHAIAVEEIDAWLLAIYEPGKDSTTTADPKKRLGYSLGRKKINTTSNYDNYLKLSKPLSKAKDLKRNRYPEFNASLKAFIEEIEEKVSK